MRALYICYWGLSDPLTVSSVMPSLVPLKQHLGLERLTLVTVERKGASYPRYNLPFDFVDHIPMTPMAGAGTLASKAYEMLMIPRRIAEICLKQGVDLVFARCSLAGTIAYKVHKSTGIPFIVESFEPHSEYMVNCGAWPKGGWRYRYAQRYEKHQVEHALKLITVTENYRRYLISAEGLDESRVAVIPCVTDLEQTRFDPELRERVRGRLGIGGATAAVYVGKFGDLYYDDEAFTILEDAFAFFEGLQLILLTPTDPLRIRARLRAHKLPESRVHIASVARSEVPAYLSAADFAYSFVRPHAASLFQCPIKHGEYWACGLPFIAPDRIGDDYKVIASDRGGANLDHTLTNIRECHETIAEIIARPDHRASIRQLAVRYKGVDIIDRVYSQIFGPTSRAG